MTARTGTATGQHARARIARTAARIEEALGHRLAGYLLLLGLVALYLVRYAQTPYVPADAADGWWTWWDQGRYLRSAVALSRLSLDASSYWYPLGYPALGALFVRWLPVHPFLLPNLVLFVAAAWLYWRLCRLWLSRLQALLVGLLALVLLRTELTASFIIPWNTIPTHCLAYLLIYRFLAPGRLGPRRLLQLVLIVGVVYLFRPADAVFLSPVLAAAVLLQGSVRRVLLAAAWGVPLLALFPLGVGALNLQLFGSWQTPYEAAQFQEVGFSLNSIGQRVYGLLVDGSAIDGTRTPMLVGRMPWLLAAPLGALLSRRELGRRFVGVAVSLAVCFGLYFLFNDFYPARLYGWLLIHYLTWALPLLLLLSALLVVDLSRRGALRDRRRLAALAALAALWLLGWSIRLGEAEVTPLAVGAEGRLVPLQSHPRLRRARFDILQLPPGQRTGRLYLAGRPGKKYRDFSLIDGRYYLNRPLPLGELRLRGLAPPPPPGRSYAARLRWRFDPLHSASPASR